MKNQKAKVLSYLQSGKTLNQAQASGLFGVQSLSKVVSDLRQSGHCVYTTSTKTTGATAYRLGRPTKRMVAAAYLVLGPEVFA